MLTVEKSLSTFLTENKEGLLALCIAEGFMFSVKESTHCITVQCTFPSEHIRFIIFDDHRIHNPHGTKPHVCNQWHKSIGDPISFTFGKEVTDTVRLEKILQASVVMCLTQCDAYNDMKAELFL